jgi:hypothetical protein
MLKEARAESQAKINELRQRVTRAK